MTEPTEDPWDARRALLPIPGEPTPTGLDPRDQAELWQLLTTYDRDEGTDTLTGQHVELDDAIVIVFGGLSESAVLDRKTWTSKGRDGVQAALFARVLSTIDAAELATRVDAVLP